MVMERLQVLPLQSGFGKLGAWMAGRAKHIYMINGAEHRQCLFDKPDLLHDVAFSWSGI